MSWQKTVSRYRLFGTITLFFATLCLVGVLNGVVLHNWWTVCWCTVCFVLDLLVYFDTRRVAKEIETRGKEGKEKVAFSIFQADAPYQYQVVRVENRDGTDYYGVIFKCKTYGKAQKRFLTLISSARAFGYTPCAFLQGKYHPL